MMKANEIYQQDLAGTSAFARNGRKERRLYYLELREALRDECAGGRRCELIENLGKLLDKKQLSMMYLLDAAAIWECYERVIEGNRNSRDIASGLPFKVEGRILPWHEVQRMSESGDLPVAIMDAEMENRLTALLKYSAARGILRDRPLVNIRATIRTADPRTVELPESKAGKAHGGEEAELRAENERLRQSYDGHNEQLDALNRQLDALRADNAALRGQIDQLQQHHETTREYAIRAANSILAGKTEEARAIASQLEEKLLVAVEELEHTAAQCRALQESLASTQEKIEVDRAQLRALRQQEQEAAREAVDLRGKRAQAQLDAAGAVKDQQSAQVELDEAMTLLSAETKTLRSLRRKAEEARRACELTQRQIEGLS